MTREIWDSKTNCLGKTFDEEEDSDGEVDSKGGHAVVIRGVDFNTD